MAGRSNRIDKKLYYITMIITALILAVLMVFEATREGVVGFFGWAVCVYIPALFALGALLLSGKKPSLTPNRIIIFLVLFILFVCTMHILLAKSLITSGDSYILAPLQGYDTVGGMLISLVTAPFKLIFSNYGLLLAVFFIMTAVFGFFALYPYILTFKDNDRPKKQSKPETQSNKEPNKLFVKNLDEPTFSSFPSEQEPLITFAPKVPADRRQLFDTLKDENELRTEQEVRSAAILFNKEEPEEKEEKPKYGALGRLADTGIKESDLYTNQGRQRLFEENIAKTFGRSDPIADYNSRYGDSDSYKSAYNSYKEPKPSPYSERQVNYYGSSEVNKYGEQQADAYSERQSSYSQEQFQTKNEPRQRADGAINPSEYINKPLTPQEYAPFKEIMGEEPEIIVYPPRDPQPREEQVSPIRPHVAYPPRETAYSPITENRQQAAPPAQQNPHSWNPTQKTGVQENLFSSGESKPASKLRPYMAPPLELLTNYPAGGADFPENYNEIKDKINEVMASAGIAAEVVSAKRGPTFTRYELKVEAGQSVQKVVAQSTMLKMRLLADSIRILAPIRGRDAVGIEIPNTKRDIVGLRSVIGSREFNTAKGGVYIAFGKTLEGAPYIDDLAKMPHILIAGATGTGKSVFINGLITSILYKYSPDDVRLLLIDPKKVELSVYQNLPNLLIKETVKEPPHAVNLLRWLTQEMDRRYDFLEKIGCNELEFYNEKVRDKTREPKIPRIVLVIDEMADLMVKGKGQVEEYIVRLAQLGRASGIHLVLATQRPTVNVITGLIRTNILARVAFTVKTNQDSRIILDEVGAEGLLGNGDLLYSYKSELERIQGAYVDIKDIKEVCDYIKKHNDANFNDELATLIKNEPQEEQAKERSSAFSERDNDYEATLKRILKTYILENRASISNAQAKHNVGYIKAKKILDDLADRGFVSSGDPSKPRQVLITMEEYKKIFESDE